MLSATTVLGHQTIATTQTDLEREVTVEIVSDAEAALGLTEDSEDGLHTNGELFEGEPRTAPARFDVVNQLTELIDVTVTTDQFLVTTEPAHRHGRTVDMGSDRYEQQLEPGAAIESLTLHPSAVQSGASNTESGLIDIEAEGPRTSIDATRTLTLEPAISIDGTRHELARQDDGPTISIELDRVDTRGHHLERIALAADDPVFAGATTDDISVSIAGAAVPVRVARHSPTSLAVALTEPRSGGSGDTTIEVGGLAGGVGNGLAVDPIQLSLTSTMGVTTVQSSQK